MHEPHPREDRHRQGCGLDNRMIDALVLDLHSLPQRHRRTSDILDGIEVDDSTLIVA